jgi:hypothetical protein
VILVLAVTPNDGVYLVNEHYKAGMRISEMVDTAKGLKKIYNIERFYCDPSSPANILEFNKAKLTAIPADNDIRPGIDAVYDLIARDKFKVFSGRAPNFLDEISIYHYPAEPDIGADTDVKEQLPVKQYDHAMDALRYPLYAINANGAKKRNAGVAGTTDRELRSHKADHLLLAGVEEEHDW